MTTARRWRTAFASAVGTSHQKTGAPCQDAGACKVIETSDGREVLLAAVSDGAGTASRSDIGAALAIQEFIDRFAEALGDDADLGIFDEAWMRAWFRALQAKIAARAAADGAAPAAYASTILGMVAGPSKAVYLQLGDGAIVVEAEGADDYVWVFWPQHGEYANSTYFITQDDSETMLQLEWGPAPREVALFSDGIERLVLDMAARTVHSPAFRPIFDWLAGTEPDRSCEPSPALLAYLASDHINRRTDDDKTLVMATRAERSGDRAERSGDRAERSAERAERSGDRAERSGDRAERSTERAERSGDRAERSGDRAERSTERAERSAKPQ